MAGYNVISSIPEIVWVDNKKIDVLRLETEYYKSKYVKCLKQIEGMPNILLGEIAEDVKDGPGGWGIKASEYVEDGVPMLRGVNIVDGLLSIDNCVFITEEKQKELKRSRVVKDDVLLVVRGSVGIGKSAVYSEPYEANMNAAVVKITLKQDVVDPYYLSCFFNSIHGRLQTERLANGVNQQNTNLTEVRSNIIPIPSPEIQKYIGDKVRKAEELGEEAKKIKKEYEDLIQDIYCDINSIKFPKGIYFVQNFDLDNKNLRIDSNFYNPLYNNENIKCDNMIKLSKLMKLKNNSKIQSEKEYIYYEIGDLSISSVLEEKERIIGAELPGRAKLELKKNDIIVSLVQESIQVTSYVDEELKNALTTNGCAVLSPKDKSISEYLYAIISSKYFIAQKCKYISGTNIRSMTKDDLLDMSVPIAEENIVNQIGRLVSREFSSIRKSKQLIQEAKQDVQDLIEGNFDMSKLSDTTPESR